MARTLSERMVAKANQWEANVYMFAAVVSVSLGLLIACLTENLVAYVLLGAAPVLVAGACGISKAAQRFARDMRTYRMICICSQAGFLLLWWSVLGFGLALANTSLWKVAGDLVKVAVVITLAVSAMLLGVLLLRPVEPEPQVEDLEMGVVRTAAAAGADQDAEPRVHVHLKVVGGP